MGGGSGRLFEFDWEGVGLRLALILKLFLLLGWRLFEVDANSRLGAYSNKYGIKYRAAISTIEGHFSQLKLKLHKLWRTAQWQIFKLHPVFLKILWLFGLEGQLENLDWTGLDFFFRGVIFFGGEGVGVVLFFLVWKKIAFLTFPQQAIFFHLVFIWGGREGLYFSFSLCFSLRLVALFDSRPSRFTWKLKKMAGVDVTTVANTLNIISIFFGVR